MWLLFLVSWLSSVPAWHQNAPLEEKAQKDEAARQVSTRTHARMCTLTQCGCDARNAIAWEFRSAATFRSAVLLLLLGLAVLSGRIVVRFPCCVCFGTTCLSEAMFHGMYHGETGTLLFHDLLLFFGGGCAEVDCALALAPRKPTYFSNRWAISAFDTVFSSSSSSVSETPRGLFPSIHSLHAR